MQRQREATTAPAPPTSRPWKPRTEVESQMVSRDRQQGGASTVLAVMVATVALVLGLAACGGGGGGANEGETTTAKAGPVKGELTISNWPGYIDPGKSGTVAEFEGKTGVK